MRKFSTILLLLFVVFISTDASAQSDSIVLRDIAWDNSSPAGFIELGIPSGNAIMQGFIYKANGGQKHPTLLLLHGFPGNERNLDLAQVVRAHGMNVIYFNYRGSWGGKGQFSFKHCVEDVVNVVRFFKNTRTLYKLTLRILFCLDIAWEAGFALKHCNNFRI